METAMRRGSENRNDSEQLTEDSISYRYTEGNQPWLARLALIYHQKIRFAESKGEEEEEEEEEE